MSCCAGRALVALLVAGPSAAAALTFAEALSRPRESSQELAVAAELAGARQTLIETAARLADGPTLALQAGPRRSGEATEADLGLDLDVPLFAGAAARRALAEELARAERLLPAAAAAESRAALGAALAEAWAAQELVLVRADAHATVERWLASVERRVEAGAEAPLEADLVAVEGRQADLALAEAKAERSRAWAALAALAELPGPPLPLVEPPTAAAWDAPTLRARFHGGVALAAVAARRDLTSALASVEQARAQSRWALRGTLAREGEEEVARLGVAWRLPRRGEIAVGAATTAADRRFAARVAELAGAELSGRLESALELLAGLDGAGPAPDLDRALAGLEARLVEGKSSPSQVLPLRRQLLAAREAELRRAALRLRVQFEIEALTSEVTP